MRHSLGYGATALVALMLGGVVGTSVNQGSTPQSCLDAFTQLDATLGSSWNSLAMAFDGTDEEKAANKAKTASAMKQYQADRVECVGSK